MLLKGFNPLIGLRCTIRKTNTRNLSLTRSTSGPDKRQLMVGAVKKDDSVAGEKGAIGIKGSCYELIDENIFDKVIGGVKFKDIPVVHIICTRNTTKIDLTRGNGAPLMYKTAGTEGFLKCRKGTTVAAQAVARRIVNHCRDIEVDQIRVVFNGLGAGRDASYKIFETSGINIVSLSDRTPAIEPWIQRPHKARRV